MIGLPSTVRIYLSSAPADMRRGFDGLAAMVREYLGEDPLSGHLFVFRNKRADRIKILYWDRSGFALWYKRLEQGTFRFPPSDSGKVQVESGQLTLLLEGIELASARQHKRFRR